MFKKKGCFLNKTIATTVGFLISEWEAKTENPFRFRLQPSLTVVCGFISGNFAVSVVGSFAKGRQTVQLEGFNESAPLKFQAAIPTMNGCSRVQKEM